MEYFHDQYCQACHKPYMLDIYTHFQVGDSSTNYIQFINTDRVLTVTGDFGNWVFCRPFVPSPDGSFYYTGFGALLDDITAAIDTTVNQVLDAGALQNAQGGFIGAGVNMRSGDLKFRLGEWKRLDVTGGTLRDNIVPLNLPGPSAVLFSMLEMLIGFAKEITSIQDILTGASQGVNTPATTTLAQIEQATKLMTGIFKRIHRSFWAELKILFGLNRDFLDEEAYYEIFDVAPPVMGAAPAPGANEVPEVGQEQYEAQMAAQMQQTGKIGRQYYETKGLDVMPVSDPTQVNDALKAVRAEGLMQFNGDPMVNQQEIRRRYFEGTGQPNVKELLTVPPPQPDPAIVTEAAKLANERDKTKSQIRKDNAAAAASLMSAAQSAQMMRRDREIIQGLKDLIWVEKRKREYMEAHHKNKL